MDFLDIFSQKEPYTKNFNFDRFSTFPRTKKYLFDKNVDLFLDRAKMNSRIKQKITIFSICKESTFFEGVDVKIGGVNRTPVCFKSLILYQFLLEVACAHSSSFAKSRSSSAM